MVREFQSVIGQRGARADASRRSAGCRMPSSRASAAAATRWASSTRSSNDRDVRLIGVEAGGRGIAPGAARGALRRRQRRRAAGHAQLRAAGRRRQHRADAFDFGRPRLRRGRTRARVAARHRRAPSTPGSTMTRRSRRSSGWRARKGSCRRWSPRTPSPTPAGSRRRCRAIRSCWSTCRAAATRTCSSIQKALGGAPQGARDDVADDRDASRASETPAVAVSSRISRPAIPIAARSGASCCGRRRRRRRRARGRRAVFGSARRRPGHPARHRTRAGRRHDAARHAGPDRAVRPRVDTPIVLFTYANPVLRMGVEAFARAAADAGVDGVLILDYPVEEAEPLRERDPRCRDRSDLPDQPDDHRRAHPAIVRSSGAGFSI